jgi:hypothetical protein
MSEGERQCLDVTTWRHRHWTFSGYGEWDGGRVDVGTGEALLNRATRETVAGDGPDHKPSGEGAGSSEGVRAGRSTGKRGQHNPVEPQKGLGAREGPVPKSCLMGR